MRTMRRFGLLQATTVILAAAVLTGTAVANPLGSVEPRLRISPGGAAGPRVALTFDACMGRTDMRILSVLIDRRIPATIFVTGRWLERNRTALAAMLAHPELFEIEDHGALHVPAVDRAGSIYGVRTAGSRPAVEAEVENGAAAILQATGKRPHWFRGATARYSPSAIADIRRLGYKIAGFSINGDQGALLGSAATRKRIASARDGDVVIAHINQPARQAGAGVLQGIADLQARGATFVRLMDVAASGSDGTTAAATGGF